MNKPILMPQLTATRARTGMNRVGDLIALLIKQYELQDQLRQTQLRQTQQRQAQQHGTAAKEDARPSMTAQFANATTKAGKSTPVQATFAWFDSSSGEPVGV